MLLGTVPYMSPEQLHGRDVDARSDLFSFGALLYEMLAGRRAFDGDSHAGIVAAILQREPPSLASIQPVTPPGLDRLVHKCLAKDPETRWQAASDVADELRWLTEGSGSGRSGRAAGRESAGRASAEAPPLDAGGPGAGVCHAIQHLGAAARRRAALPVDALPRRRPNHPGLRVDCRRQAAGVFAFEDDVGHRAVSRPRDRALTAPLRGFGVRQSRGDSVRSP
jgi:hypothetical protein